MPAAISRFTFYGHCSILLMSRVFVKITSTLNLFLITIIWKLINFDRVYFSISFNCFLMIMHIFPLLPNSLNVPELKDLTCLKTTRDDEFRIILMAY